MQTKQQRSQQPPQQPVSQRAPNDAMATAGQASAGIVIAPPMPYAARTGARLNIAALQRTVGNRAVNRLLNRAPTETEQPASRVADLAKQVRSPETLRTMLAADPSLAHEIQAYFAAGNDDAQLNDLMAAAFRPVQATNEQEGAKEATEKDPTDPALPLPADRAGDKKLLKGQMKWTLKAVDHSSARVDVDFKPNQDTVEARTVSFVQTVLNQVGDKLAYAGGTAAQPDKNKAKFEPFEEPTTKKRVDHLPDSENDPFYGAEWDQANKKWKNEAGLQIGSSVKGTSSSSATLNDTPAVGWAREGKGDTSTQFETVPVILETREPLGALTWGFKIKDAANSPIELTGGEDKDCTDTPSDTWGATLDQFYEGKYEEILDNYEIAKADLKPDHKIKLDGIAAKMKANVALKAQLGGAADLTGNAEFNKQLSLKRAETARDYLVGKGIDAGRLEVQSYSFDWARVQTEEGKSEGKNRRVQVWLH